jgi:hypothetical protein
MRVAPWAWISVGLLFGACSDEKPSPIVNEDISWIVGCVSGKCGSGLTSHSQEGDLDTPYTTTCGHNGAFFQLSVRDPGRSAEFETPEGDIILPRYPSTVRVTNITENGDCDVEVSEQDVGASGEFKYRASCGEGCTLDVQGAQENWDFVGELSCDGLTAFDNATEGAPRYSLSQTDGSPVLIKVGNCD